MTKVGCHVSIAGGISKSVQRAADLGCTTFQIFSRNPRGWKFSDLPQEEIAAFVIGLSKSGIAPTVDHMPYLPNLASPREEVYEKSVATLTAELVRCNLLGIPYLVTHLGSHLGSGDKVGRLREIGAINRALSSAEGEVMLLLENTAGTKNSLGGTFEQIREIMDGIELADRVGICFDTCHGFVAGYDLKTPDGVMETFEHFDEVIGAEYLRLVHLNDSKGGIGSRLDRHEHIGLGAIGEEGFSHILGHALVRTCPLILETPVDARRGDRGNIMKVRELLGQIP